MAKRLALHVRAKGAFWLGKLRLDALVSSLFDSSTAFLIFGLCFQMSVIDVPFAMLQVPREYNGMRISATDFSLPPSSVES